MRACERLFGLLFFCCAVWLLGCDEHLAGTHEAEVTFTVKGHAPERTPTPSSSSHAKPQTLAEAAISPVLTRLATLHITADAEPVGDDKIKLTLDKDQVETAEDGLKWPGGIELDDLDAEFTMPLAQAGGLVEKTEVIDGKTVKFWEGARIDIAHAIGATKVPEGHKLVGQAYDSMRGRTRWIHTPSLAVLAGGVSSVSRINGGKGISIKLRPDTAAAMKEAADHTHGPVAIVRGTSVLVVQPITAATSSFDVSFGDDIYSYTRAHMTMKLLETPPVPPLERIEVKPLAPDWSVAIACIVIPIIMSIGWLVFVRRFDRAQPEPWWLVLATFALAIVSRGQVDVPMRLFVFNWTDDDATLWRGVAINPILWVSPVPIGPADEEKESEGCLSVPGERYPLRRSELAILTAVDLDQKPFEIRAEGWLARIFQHEYDHLEGVLYVDRLDHAAGKAAAKAVKKSGWGEPGLSWMPGIDDLEG